MNNTNPTSEFNWPIRVYYEDTDSGGVVYYANYLKFLERARTEYLRNLGFEQDQLRAEFGAIFVVRSVNVEYLQPARFNELLQVSAKVSEVRRTSVLFEQIITRDGDSKPLITAKILIVCIDADSFRPKVIPKEMSSEIIDDN